MCLLAHQGIMRSGELMRLTAGCVRFYSDTACTIAATGEANVAGVEILIYDGKTNKGGPPQSVFLALRQDGYDAVKLLLRYMGGLRAQFKADPNRRLFNSGTKDTKPWEKAD